MIEQLTFLSYSSEHSHRFSNSDPEGFRDDKVCKRQFQGGPDEYGIISVREAGAREMRHRSNMDSLEPFRVARITRTDSGPD